MLRGPIKAQAPPIQSRLDHVQQSASSPHCRTSGGYQTVALVSGNGLPWGRTRPRAVQTSQARPRSQTRYSKERSASTARAIAFLGPQAIGVALTQVFELLPNEWPGRMSQSAFGTLLLSVPMIASGCLIDMPLGEDDAKPVPLLERKGLLSNLLDERRIVGQ